MKQIYVTTIESNGNFSFELYYWIYFDEGKKFRETVSSSILGIEQIGVENNIVFKDIKWQSDEEDGTSAERFGINS